MSGFRATLSQFVRREEVRLIGVLALAAVLAFLYRDGSSAEAVANLDPATRTRLAEISAPDLHGNQWTLAGERGSIVLVNFWASWCPPCRAETPGLVRFADAHRSQGVKVVGISLDEDHDAVRRFVADFRVPYTIVLPADSSALSSSISSLPTSFLLDREGRIAKTYIGAVSEADLTRDIAWLQKEN
jgi:thiol-disulfide isomerase/thioredoxin